MKILITNEYENYNYSEYLQADIVLLIKTDNTFLIIKNRFGSNLEHLSLNKLINLNAN